MNLNGDFDFIPEPAEPEDDGLAKVFFEDITPGEVPQLDNDVTIFASMEDAFSDLELLTADIRNTKGMSQSFALEADRLLPGFINEDRPLGYFTKAPSATLLKASMEELTNGQKGLVALAVASLIGIVVKIISWFSNRSSEKKNDTATLSTNAEKREVAAETLAKTVETVNNEAPRGNDVNSMVERIAKDDPHSRAALLTSEVSPLMYDYLDHNGVILRMIKDIYGPTFDSCLAMTNNFAERLRKLIDNEIFNWEEPSYSHNHVEIEKLLKENHEYFNNTKIEITFQGSRQEVAEVGRRFKEIYHEIESGSNRRIASFTEALKRYQAVEQMEAIGWIAKHETKYLTLIQSLEIELERAKKRMDGKQRIQVNPHEKEDPQTESVTGDGMEDKNGLKHYKEGTLDKQYHDVLTAAISKLGKTTVAYQNILQLSMHFIEQQGSHAYNLMKGAVGEIDKEIARLEKLHKDKDNALYEELVTFRKSWKAAFEKERSKIFGLF